MGSTLGSVLQGIGSTGEDVGKADISNQVMQHQFTMDYLANQARNRELDINQQRTNQEMQIAHSQLNLQTQQQQIEQQRYEREGMVYAGTTKDASGRYNRVYQNPQTQKGVSIPYSDGELPIDSPEGKIAASKMLQDAGISKEAADRSVFGMTATGDPIEQASSLIQLRQQHDPSFKKLPYNQQLSWAMTSLRDMRLTNPTAIMLTGGAGQNPSGAGGNNDIQYWQDKVNDKDSGVLLKDVPAAIRPLLDARNLPPQISPQVRMTVGMKQSSIDSTLDLINRIEPDLDLVKGLPSASLVDLASNPEGYKALISRSLRTLTHPLISDQDEARIERLSGNLRSLNEFINTIRSPLGGTGFRGGEAYDNMLAQGIKPLTLPGVNKQVLDNTRGMLQGLKTVLDHGMGTGDGGPLKQESVPPDVSAALANVGPGKHTLSDKSVWIKSADGTISKGTKGK